MKLAVTGSTCDPGVRVGTASMVFLKGGHIIGLYRGAIAIGNEPGLDRMKQWAAAHDDADRAAVAATAMTAAANSRSMR